MGGIDTRPISPTKLTLTMNEPDTAASGVLTSDNTQVTAGKIVTIGDLLYTFVTTLLAVKASTTVDIGTTGPTNGETLVLGAKTYTFVSALTTDPATVPNEILIEADVDDTLQNLKDAINTGAVADKVSVGTTPNADVDAGAINTTDHTLALEATVAGAAGNDITVTDGLTDTTVAAFSGGADAPGAYSVKIGADADGTLANLQKAINGTGTPGTEYSVGTSAHPDVTCGDVTAHAVTVTAKVAGLAGNSIAKDEDDDHLDWDGTGGFLTGGDINDVDSIAFGSSGYVNKLLVIAPDMPGSATYVLRIKDKDGNIILESSALNENALSSVTVGFVLVPDDVIEIDASVDLTAEQAFTIIAR